MDWNYINMLVTERYWDDIEEAFSKVLDCKCISDTKQIIHNGIVYQCRMVGNFCIGLIG